MKPPKPLVVVLAGPPCSGKSTAGAWLAAELDGIHVQVDSILTAILPNSDRKLDDRLLAYEIAALAIRPILARGRSVILDCTYSRREYRRQVLCNVTDEDTVIVIEFLVSSETALARFRNRRGHDATDLTTALVRDRVSTYPYGFGTAVVDGERSMEEIGKLILQSLSQGLDRQNWIDGGA